MECTIFKNKSFAALENTTLNNISANISKELAFSICAFGVEREDVDATQVLQLWITKLSIAYSFKDFGEVDWQHLTYCCQNYFVKNTHDEKTSDIDGINCKLCSWLKVSYDFLKTVQCNANKINLSGLSLFLSFMLETVQNCCTFFQLNANNADWTSKKELVNSVYNLSLNVMWGFLDSTEEVDAVAYSSTIPFMNRICLSSMQNSCLDIKTKIEIWKYAAKFALRYHSCSNMQYKSYKIDEKWPKSPMSLLIVEIRRNILVIYTKELNEDVQYVEKYLRVTGFYLKILYEFSTVFQHSNFPVSKELFDLLLLTISAPDFIKMSNVFTFVKKHVLDGIINILPMMFMNNEFEKMVNNHVGNSFSFCFELVVSYLHACIRNGNIKYLADNVELFWEIFTKIFQRGDIFVQASSFEEIMEIYAALTLLDSTRSLLCKMQQYVLKGNSALSFGCTEVLIFVSSLNDHNDGLKSKTELWDQVDDQFASFSSNCKRLNVERLRLNKYMLCTNQRFNSPDQKSQYPLSKYSLYNQDLLRCIKDGNYKTELKICNGKSVSCLYRLIEKFECDEISVEDHYEIVGAIYKLARSRAVICNNLQKKIADLMESVVSAWMLNPKTSFTRFLCTGFVLIASSSNEMQLKILAFIRKSLRSGVKLSMMGFWILLRACCKQQNDLELYKLAQLIIADSEMPDIIRASMFENSIIRTTINTSVEIQHYSHIENLSKCTMCIKPYFTHRKRLRPEITYEGNNPEDLVQNVCQTLKNIISLSKHLKQSEIEKLNNICSDIKTITESHKKQL